MGIHTFVSNYQGVFGMQAELPITFWYSDRLEAPIEKISGCLFKCMKLVGEGKRVSLNAETMGYDGGKFYTELTEIPEHIPNSVSLKEKYKRTPEMVTDSIREIQAPKARKNYLHPVHIDWISSFDDVGGILFLATSDILSGLAIWAYYDNNAPDTIPSPFGSKCCSIVIQAILENQKQRRRIFLRFLDPSVRLYSEADILSLAVPISRFKVMYRTMRESCLFDTYAWGKVKEKVQKSSREEVSSNRPAVPFRILPDIQPHGTRIEDAAAIYYAIDTHRDYMCIWLSFVGTLKSTIDEEESLRSVLPVPSGRYEPIFGAWNEHNEICRLIGFYFSDFVNHRTEIEYWLLPEHQHHGIVIQCVRYLCRWATETKEIRRTQIRCATNNAASSGVPSRLGFRLEGMEHAGELLALREYTDVHVYSMLKEETEASF